MKRRLFLSAVLLAAVVAMPSAIAWDLPDGPDPDSIVDKPGDLPPMPDPDVPCEVGIGGFPPQPSIDPSCWPQQSPEQPPSTPSNSTEDPEP